MDLVYNDPILSCCGTRPCSCPDKTSTPTYNVPDRMPTPPGMVDNDCDENDILLTPMEAVSNAHKTKCEQCNGLGSLPDPTVVPDTYDFGFAPRQIQCALCEGKGFTIEGGVNIDSAAPHLAAAMADRQTDNAAQLVYGVSPGATQSDFDEDDILLPNQF